MGLAMGSFNLALAYAQQGQLGQALPLMQQAAETWKQVGNPQAQQAEQLVAQIRAMLR
jgi:hypothetical protein